MRGRLIDLSFGLNRRQRVTVELDRDFREDFDSLKETDVNVEIKKWRNPRSLDANAYFHVLVNKIAEAKGLSDEEVKRDLVVDYGAIARDDDGNKMGAILPISANPDDYYDYNRWYKSMTIEGREYNCYLFYKRTHLMDSKEMSRLIDGAIYVAQDLGIDTDTPEQIARYKEAWDGR